MKYKFFLLLFVMPLFLFAQDDDLPPTDDTPLAPIDNWIPLFIIVALVYGFFIFSKNIRQLSKN